MTAGLGVGVGLLVLSRLSFRALRPGSAEAGLAIAAISLLGRLAAATILLWAYSEVAPSGLLPFGLSLAFGFIGLYGIELVRFAGLHRYLRPARTRS